MVGLVHRGVDIRIGCRRLLVLDAFGGERVTGYVSTRGEGPVSFADAVLRGIPSDGGLFVPVSAPSFEWPPPHEATASWAASDVICDLDSHRMRRIGQESCDFPFPLVEIDPGIYVLELFHGPTHAFKDVGARFMAGVVAELVAMSGPAVTILVATSGDTGGAVANAFFGRPGTKVVALFPLEGVSDRQRRQMTTLGSNIYAVGVEGTFDDCQGMVKACFADTALAARHGLTSANSINVARLLPQTIYYLDAARRFDRAVHFVVPSGNLGNLCAGLIAARGGMPHAGFTAAFNENHRVADYLGGESFQPGPSVRTASNAMDVGNPSNLERIRHLYNFDDDALRAEVRGTWVSDRETVSTIGDVYRRSGYVMDPHTAVAYAAAARHHGSDSPVVVLSTAHPAKFPEVVEDAIGGPVPIPPSIHAARQKEEMLSVIGPRIQELHVLLDGSGR